MKANRARKNLSFLSPRISFVLALSTQLSWPLHAQEDAGAPILSNVEEGAAPAEQMPSESQNQAAVGKAILGLQAKIEPDPVEFGETFNLVIEVKHHPELQVDLPTKVPEKAALPQVGKIRRVTKPPKATMNESAAPKQVSGADPSAPLVTRFTIPFLALGLEDLKTPAMILRIQSGEPVEIPELPVPVRSDSPEGSPGTAGGPNINPASPKPAETGALRLEQAPGPIVFSVFDERPLWLLLAVFLAAVVHWVYRKLSGRKFELPSKAAPSPPQRPPHEVALERLDALLAEGLLARAEINVFVTRLMDEVLRDFLEARFAVAAGRRTTRELMVSLLDTSALGLDVGGTRAVLEQADLVKFARATLAADAAHKMAERVRALILATTAVPDERMALAEHAEASPSVSQERGDA